MLRWLTTNLRTLLLAFALALAVWVTAVTASNPDETNSLPAPIPIEFIGQDASLLQIGSVPHSVEVSLRAPKSVWEQILADPASVRAIVDMTGLGSGTHTVEVALQVSAQPVRIVSVSPRTVELVLEPLASRTLPISLVITGEPALGYQAGEPVLTPGEVNISGPESLVSQAAVIQAGLDLTNTRENVEASLPLTALDADGKILSGLTFSPQTVEVSLPVVHLGGYRDLAVKVVTVGRPASGYRLASVAVFPPVVTVYSGDRALIESLPGYVETLPLNLSGVSENIETRLDLALPADVTLVGEMNVLVQVTIVPLEGSLMVAYRPVEVTGLGAGFTAQVSPTTVDVIISGPLPILDTLRTSDVRVRIDLTGRGAGAYQLTPTVTLLVEGLTVESILPGTVQVTINASATPTPR
jgi:YbbR domain-containing protein